MGGQPPRHPAVPSVYFLPFLPFLLFLLFFAMVLTALLRFLSSLLGGPLDGRLRNDERDLEHCRESPGKVFA